MLLQGAAGHVVHDAHSEVVLGLVLSQVLIHSKDALGRGVLGAQAVAAAHDHLIGDAGASQSGNDIQVQGIAQGSGLLGAVQNSDLLGGGGNGGDQLVRLEGAVQTDLDQANLLTVGIQVVNDLLRHVADGAHGDDDPVGIGSAIVVE